MFKIRFILLGLLLSGASSLFGQCTAGFSFSASDNFVSFQNISVLSNARYYWDFGLGVGSTDENPNYVYPDNGRYEVSLYAQDTLSGCTDVFSAVLQISKPDSFPCGLDASVVFTPANNTVFMSTIDQTTNCPPFSYIDCDAGPQENGAWSTVIGDTNQKAIYLDRLQYIDTVAGAYHVLGEFYQTVPYQFDPVVSNYDSCSANFEAFDISDPFVQQFEFAAQAMNTAGTNYSWRLERNGQVLQNANGLAGTFPVNAPTLVERADFYLLTLIVEDNVHNCTDSLTRQLALQNGNFSPLLELEPVEIDAAPLRIYPNPTAGPFQVKKANSNLELRSVRVVDISGRILLQEILEGDRIQLNAENWPNGRYWVGIGRDADWEWRALQVHH